MSKIEPACRRCRYSYELPDDVVYQCRRYAPRPLTVEDDPEKDEATYWGEWPQVFNDQWCGEFAAK
jgi:hypothetical protein